MVEQYEAGRQVVAQSGCLACHKIGENGNDGPGPELTEIGDRLPGAGDRSARSINPTAPMPSFASLQQKQPEKFKRARRVPRPSSSRLGRELRPSAGG